jgi:hypothetical protein
MSSEDATAPRPRSGVSSLIVAGVFALLFAYDLWEAIGTAVALPASYEANGFDPATIPWWIVVLYVLVPPVTFVLALLAGRRESVFTRALVFAAALAVSAGLSLGLIALQGTLIFSSL